MEVGKITLNNGTEVDFTNTIIIFTSNLGAGKDKEGVDAAIRARLRPEFINRLDAVIAFNSLSIENLESVVDIQIRHLEETMKNKKISFIVSEDARKTIAQMGYDPMYGARPVRRIVSGVVSDMLADAIIVGDITPGDTVFIGVDENEEIYLSRNEADSTSVEYHETEEHKNKDIENESETNRDNTNDSLDELFNF